MKIICQHFWMAVLFNASSLNMSDRYASQIPKISKNCDFGDAMIESGIAHRNH